ncbi:MAG: amidohydrolase [Gammaproteobacteria bacterium]|nr:amidohydrolase [Gammaproteobacteria bacterium]
MKRRAVLGLFGAGALAAGAGAWRSWPDEGIFNPCLAGRLPPKLAQHELVQAAWAGLDAEKVWDCHVHLIGVGDGGSGVWITPQMQSWQHPLQYTQRWFYQNAGCAERAGSVDADFLAHLVQLQRDMRPGNKLMLLAFEYHYAADGRRRLEQSSYHTPNDYARAVARRYPQLFEWIASIHPYRVDSEAVLEQAVKDGARAVKWLPSAMGMDPASAQCDRFYESLARLKIPLLTHGGEELAVHGAAQADLNNPLRLRRALDHGVRVIVAHCAALGQSTDLDRGPNGPPVDNFDLFTRLMNETRYEKLLYGEISATTQVNRVGPTLTTLLTRADWHPRLINGSDYPLPGVMPLFSLRRMVAAGYLAEAEAQVISEVRRYNPVLFDFLLKRHLRVGRQQFAPMVFESRRVFAPST